MWSGPSLIEDKACGLSAAIYPVPQDHFLVRFRALFKAQWRCYYSANDGIWTNNALSCWATPHLEWRTHGTNEHRIRVTWLSPWRQMVVLPSHSQGSHSGPPTCTDFLPLSSRRDSCALKPRLPTLNEPLPHEGGLTWGALLLYVFPLQKCTETRLSTVLCSQPKRAVLSFSKYTPPLVLLLAFSMAISDFSQHGPKAQPSRFTPESCA